MMSTIESLKEICKALYPKWTVSVFQKIDKDAFELCFYKSIEVDASKIEANLKSDVFNLINDEFKKVLFETACVRDAFWKKDEEIQELKDLLKNVKIIAENQASPKIIQGVIFTNDPLNEIREAVNKFELK